jgi:NitT/TauT family transport system substrate-binding protein
MIRFSGLLQVLENQLRSRLTRLPVAAVFSLLVAVEPCCAQPTTPVVRLLVPPSNSSLPLLQLADQDPIPGVDIRAEIYQSHAQALALLLRGEADLLLTGTSQGWENYLSGGPLLMIGTGVWGISFLIGSRDCPPIDSVADLAGKSIALPFPGSPLDFQTRFLLQHHGLDPDRDLKLIYSPPPQTAALLLKGQIDAAPIPEPLASELVVNRGLQRFLDYKQTWASARGGDPKSPQVSLFTTRRFAAGNAELLGELVVGWRAATQQIMEDPAGAARRFSELLGFSEAVIAQSIPNTLFCVPLPEENRDRVRAYYEAVKVFLPGQRFPPAKQCELGDEFFFSAPP